MNVFIYCIFLAYLERSQWNIGENVPGSVSMRYGSNIFTK